MRHPFRLLLFPLAACRGEVFIDEAALEAPEIDPTAPGTGWETGPWEQPTTAVAPDTSMWDGAWVRIVSPVSDGLVPIESQFPFEAVLHGGDGAPLAGVPDRVQWFASDDPDFEGDQLSFVAGPLDLGTHEITVIVDLPNGDRVAHTVGGVRAQSDIAGTYAGLFSVDGTVNNITITCTGAAVMVIDANGAAGVGEGDCLVSVLGFDVPMTWDFEMAETSGVLTGDAAVDLLGFFSYDVPMTAGSVDSTSGMALEFAGDIPFIGTLSAFLQASRVSLDTD